MANQDKEIFKIENLEEYKRWINSQDWYQKIHLKRGITTPGKLNTDSRIVCKTSRSKKCNWIGCG